MKKIDLKLVDGEFTNPVREKVARSEDIYKIFASLKDHASETLLVAYLQHDLTGVYDIHSTGCPAWTSFSMHDLFGRAYLLRARYFILVHNHPGGKTEPSPQDLAILNDIKSFIAPMQDRLSMMDFIIVAGEHYWSWFDEEDGGEYEVGALGF